jgi:uncharacterized protein YkwD
MVRYRAAVGLATLLGLLAGGCPVDSTFALDANATGADLAGPASNSFAGLGDAEVENPAPPVAGTRGSAGSDFSTQLSARFPACGVSAREAEWREEIYGLVNRARAAAGLAPVSRNETLERQASQYACELIQYDFFAHVNPVTDTRLEDRALAFGYDYHVIGENLAAGQTTPQQAFTDWMNSPSHRDNILDPRFTQLGVGIRAGGSYNVYWVQEFGFPLE